MSFLYNLFVEKGKRVGCLLVNLHLLRCVVPGVVARSCNPAAFQAAFGSGESLLPVDGNSPSIGAWIV